MEAPEATCQGCRRGHGAECAGYRKPSGVDGDRVHGSGYGAGVARAWVPLWPYCALSPGVARHGLEEGQEWAGHGRPQGRVVATPSAALLPSGCTSAGSATSSSRASAASSGASRA